MVAGFRRRHLTCEFHGFGKLAVTKAEQVDPAQQTDVLGVAGQRPPHELRRGRPVIGLLGMPSGKVAAGRGDRAIQACGRRWPFGADGPGAGRSAQSDPTAEKSGDDTALQNDDEVFMTYPSCPG